MMSATERLTSNRRAVVLSSLNATYVMMIRPAPRADRIQTVPTTVLIARINPGLLMIIEQVTFSIISHRVPSELERVELLPSREGGAP